MVKPNNAKPTYYTVLRLNHTVINNQHTVASVNELAGKHFDWRLTKYPNKGKAKKVAKDLNTQNNTSDYVVAKVVDDVFTGT